MTPLGTTSDQLAKEFVEKFPQAKLGSLSMSGQRRVATDVTGKELQALVTEFARWIQPSGLGDVMAGVLHNVGITKDRVSRIVGTDCGCDGRQKAMNEAWSSLKAMAGIGSDSPDETSSTPSP